MAKMSKSEREECERNLALCESAVKTFKEMLAADDREAEADKAVSHAAEVQKIADGGSGDKHAAIARGVLAIREAGGVRISDQVHRERLR